MQSIKNRHSLAFSCLLQQLTPPGARGIVALKGLADYHTRGVVVISQGNPDTREGTHVANQVQTIEAIRSTELRAAGRSLSENAIEGYNRYPIGYSLSQADIHWRYLRLSRFERQVRSQWRILLAAQAMDSVVLPRPFQNPSTQSNVVTLKTHAEPTDSRVCHKQMLDQWPSLLENFGTDSSGRRAACTNKGPVPTFRILGKRARFSALDLSHGSAPAAGGRDLAQQRPAEGELGRRKWRYPHPVDKSDEKIQTAEK